MGDGVRKPDEIMRELFSILTELSHPQYMQKLPVELYMKIVSVRMDLSPTTIRETFKIETEKETKL